MKENDFKRLVIHPQDKSTEFLSKVYEDLDGVTLVRGGVTKRKLRRLITTHDQVMMLGHGSPHGLMSVGQFPDSYGHVIDDSFAELLAGKENNIFVWCNADQYVEWNDLKGFYTGMFISEVTEAILCGLMKARQSEVDRSNHSFVETVGAFAEHEPKLIHAAAKHQYGQLAETSPVAKYNHERLYVR